MFKKDVVPLRPGGQVDMHQNKGAQSAGMPDRAMVQRLAAPGSQFNDYAKASPLSSPAGTPVPTGVGPGG